MDSFAPPDRASAPASYPTIPGPGFGAVETADWTPVDPAYLKERRLGALVSFGGTTLAAAVAAFFIWDIWWISAAIALVGVVALLIRVLRMPILVDSYAYAERADDLLVRHGVMIEHLTVVPYGRMQLVEVTSGPIQRAFGLRTVKLVTAAAGTDAEIPGLRPEVAERLRDRLANLGETETAGI